MAQTFYAQEASNRRNSILLAGGVALLLGVLIFVIVFFWTDNRAWAIEAGLGAVFLGLAAGFISYRFGDRLVLSSAGAVEVTEAQEPQLVNVVTELSLAAGLPVPAIYVIEDPALNAFATGRDPAHASVAITRGLLAKLDREELQGVLGHELSHVRNYDIRYALLIGVLVGSVALVADLLFRTALFGGTDRRGSSVAFATAGFFALALLFALPAVAIAKLVQLAASRQREYLADASSAELTRNPAGLERALMILADDTTPLRTANRATQHLYIVNPLKRLGGLGLFSTHPPLGERIERLRRLSGESPLGSEEDKRLNAAQ